MYCIAKNPSKVRMTAMNLQTSYHSTQKVNNWTKQHHKKSNVLPTAIHSHTFKKSCRSAWMNWKFFIESNSAKRKSSIMPISWSSSSCILTSSSTICIIRSEASTSDALIPFRWSTKLESVVTLPLLEPRTKPWCAANQCQTSWKWNCKKIPTTWSYVLKRSIPNTMNKESHQFLSLQTTFLNMIFMWGTD